MDLTITDEMQIIILHNTKKCVGSSIFMNACNKYNSHHFIKIPYEFQYNISVGLKAMYAFDTLK